MNEIIPWEIVDRLEQEWRVIHSASPAQATPSAKALPAADDKVTTRRAARMSPMGVQTAIRKQEHPVVKIRHAT